MDVLLHELALLSFSPPACSCSVNGSATQTCNHITGECECKPNVVGPQCDSCLENYYQPDPNEGCFPCDCNPGGSTSAQCDTVTGQCDCKQGVTGMKCNEVVPGYFFPTIDHLRLEAESAVLVPPSVLTLASGEGETFTGTGYYRVVEGEGIARFDHSITFPQTGTYEVLFRYNLAGSLVWDTVTLTIRTEQVEDTTEVTDCGSGIELPVGDTSIEYTSWTMGTGVYISRTFCFQTGRSYTFILSEPNSGQSSSPTLDIDSMVIIPIDIPGLDVFDNSQLVADYMSCVDSWRRVSTISSAESICEEITFIFSTAIYNGAQGLLLYHPPNISVTVIPFQSVSVTLLEHWLVQCVSHLEVSVSAFLLFVDGHVTSAVLDPLASLPLDAYVSQH